MSFMVDLMDCKKLSFPAVMVHLSLENQIFSPMETWPDDNSSFMKMSDSSSHAVNACTNKKVH